MGPEPGRTHPPRVRSARLLVVIRPGEAAGATRVPVRLDPGLRVALALLASALLVLSLAPGLLIGFVR